MPFHPWLRGRLDGITAGECRSLLSARDYLRSGVLAHVYLQAKAQDRYGARDGDVGAELRAAGFGAALIRNNVARLRRMVEGLRWTPAQSTWSDYQRTLTYDDADRAIGDRRRRLAWDIGCNTGIYSRMAADRADYVLALDADHLVVDRLYDSLKAETGGRSCRSWWTLPTRRRASDGWAWSAARWRNAVPRTSSSASPSPTMSSSAATCRSPTSSPGWRGSGPRWS